MDLGDTTLPKRKSRADQIEARFKKFHADNPQIYKLFERFVFELINAGFAHYSGNAVFQRIRWHVNVETRSNDGLKLNDHYHAYYARLFVIAHPDHEGFFRNRKRTSTERPAYKEDIAFHYSGTPGRDEIELRERLRKLL